jgi:hypothetical protein
MGVALTDLQMVAKIACWPTPKATDADKGVRTHRGAMKELGRKGPGCDLNTIAAAAWPTPTALSPAKDGYNEAGQSCNLIVMRRLVLGLPSNGSNAETGKPGQLNPALSRWLMGYPPVWCDCAVTATRSTRGSRRSLSKPTSRRLAHESAPADEPSKH